MLGQARMLVGRVTSEMETYYERRSESWQSSERGERFVEKQEEIEELAALMSEAPWA